MDWMYRHRYGEKLAKFYIEWAMLIEQYSSISKAFDAIQKGKDLNAQPQSLLDDYYKILKNKEKNFSSTFTNEISNETITLKRIDGIFIKNINKNFN
jgi:hypothetical protein